MHATITIHPHHGRNEDFDWYYTNFGIKLHLSKIWLWMWLDFSCEAEEQSSPFLSNLGVGELAVCFDIGFDDIFNLCLWVWIGDCVGAESRLSADRVVKLLLISIYNDDANKSMILAWDQIRLPGNVNIKDHNLETKLFYDIFMQYSCTIRLEVISNFLWKLDVKKGSTYLFVQETYQSL